MEPLSKHVAAEKPTRQSSCEKHGAFTATNYFRNIWSKCPVCTDEKQQADKLFAEQGRIAQERDRLQQRLGRSAIPKRFIGRGFENFTVRNDDGRTVRAMDVLVPGVGEIIGGSQREERLDVLVQRMGECHLNPEDYWWYTDLRKYGTLS